MSRPQLSKMLEFLLSGKQNNRDIIEEVIWSWFEKNRLIENGKLLSIILESWYQQNKMAYSMLISLIFGTNQISAIDLAYEVIIWSKQYILSSIFIVFFHQNKLLDNWPTDLLHFLPQLMIVRKLGWFFIEKMFLNLPS